MKGWSLSLLSPPAFYNLVTSIDSPSDATETNSSLDHHHVIKYEHKEHYENFKICQKWFEVDKMSNHGGHQSKRKTLEMPDELCLSDIAGRPACACRWQGTYTRLIGLKGYKASAYCKRAADTLHTILNIIFHTQILEYSKPTTVLAVFERE